MDWKIPQILIELVFDPSGQGWDLSSIIVTDIDLADESGDKVLCTDTDKSCDATATEWGVNINTTTDTITLTHPTNNANEDIPANDAITVEIGVVAGGSNYITNPSSANTYEISIQNIYTAAGGGTEQGEVEIPILDSDTVNVTGFIDSFITFDIDTVTDTTAVTNTDCDATGGVSPCDSHGGVVDGAGYVVDLGEMNTTQVNKSGLSGVLHADGSTGDINAIGIDIECNADSGIALTLDSLYEDLQGPGSNEIPDVAGGPTLITAGDGSYGIREIDNTATYGSFTIATIYDGSANNYGNVSDGGTAINVALTTGPIDGRILMEVAATPDNLDGTGTYNDELTFILTATF